MRAETRPEGRCAVERVHVSGCGMEEEGGGAAAEEDDDGGGEEE